MSIIGVLEVLAAAVFWALAAILYRKGVSETRDPIQACFARCLLAFPLMSVAALVVEGTPSRITLWALAVASGAALLIGVIGDILYMIALRDAGVSIAYPIGYLYVLVATLFEWLVYKLTPGTTVIAALPLALLGVYAATPREGGRRNPALKGVVAAIGASIAWGVGVCLAKLASQELGPLTLDAYKLFLILILLSPKAKGLPNPGLKWLVLGGLFGVGIGDALFYAALPLLGASRATLISTASIPLATLASLALGERLDARRALGVTLVACAVVLASAP